MARITRQPRAKTAAHTMRRDPTGRFVSASDTVGRDRKQEAATRATHDTDSSYDLGSPRISVEELAARQGVKPVTDPTTLLGDFWPEDQSAEDFLAAVRAWRRGETDD
jgi:hypothetical protein